jgi:hypothetical protein
MLTVYKMPFKNLFLTGIGSGYYKNSYQNELQPIPTPGFSGDSWGVDYEKIGCNKPGTIFTGTEILNYSLTKPCFGLVLCARGFDANSF